MKILTNNYLFPKQICLQIHMVVESAKLTVDLIEVLSEFAMCLF